MRSEKFLEIATMSGTTDPLDEAGRLRLTPDQIVEALKLGNEHPAPCVRAPS